MTRSPGRPSSRRWPAPRCTCCTSPAGTSAPATSAGAEFGVDPVDVDARERQVVQDAVDRLAAAGIDVHGELVEATEHDVAGVIVQRAEELAVDLIVLGHQHHRGSSVAELVIRQQPHCSVLLARPPEFHGGRR